MLADHPAVAAELARLDAVADAREAAAAEARDAGDDAAVYVEEVAGRARWAADRARALGSLGSQRCRQPCAQRVRHRHGLQRRPPVRSSARAHAGSSGRRAAARPRVRTRGACALVRALTLALAVTLRRR